MPVTLRRCAGLRLATPTLRWCGRSSRAPSSTAFATDPAAVALDAVTAYAYARAGYHRGLDALRRSGWRGQGYIPVSHIPNRGFLAALIALGDSARLIGETEEADRIAQFVQQSDPEALAFLARGVVAGPAGTEEQE